MLGVILRWMTTELDEVPLGVRHLLFWLLLSRAALSPFSRQLLVVSRLVRRFLSGWRTITNTACKMITK